MKKIILVAALVLGFAAAAAAQPRAVGLRGGWGTELSYQHTMGDSNFIEADLGLFGFGSLNAVATYNWMLAQPNWTGKGEWGVYAGPGAAVGFGFTSENPGLNVAVVGQVGLEYTFWFPLQLSVDLRPQIGFHLGENAGFYKDGLLGFAPCLSVRYRF